MSRPTRPFTDPRGCTRQDPSAEQLKADILHVLQERSCPGQDLSKRLWRMFVQHPWYRAQLRASARLVLRRGHAPAQWPEDLEHDAMLLLARDLRRTVDLHLDAVRADRHFSGLMVTIIVRNCHQALRRMRRLHRSTVPLWDADLVTDDRVQIDAQIDVSVGLARVPEPDRTVLQLYSQGYQAAEIQHRLGWSNRKVYRVLQRGLRTLKGALSGKCPHAGSRGPRNQKSRPAEDRP